MGEAIFTLNMKKYTVKKQLEGLIIVMEHLNDHNEIDYIAKSLNEIIKKVDTDLKRKKG